MIFARDASGIARQLHDKVQHRAILLRKRELGVVLLKLVDKIRIQCDSTQKLCVGFDSIMATVVDRDDRGNHLVLSSRQRQFGRHQSAKGGEGVM